MTSGADHSLPSLDLKAITVLLLVGGLGTRLRSVVPNLPKPLAQVNGRPFLEHLLEQLHEAGFRHIVMCVGYRAQQVQEHFADGSAWGLNIRYSRENEPLGTGGALGLARDMELDQALSEPVLVMNGDAYCDTDFAALCQAHASSGASGTLVAMQVPSRARFGCLTFSSNGTLLAFEEKDGQEVPGWINGGVYLLSQAILASIPAGNSSLERDIFPAWIGRGLQVYKTQGKFIDIGLPEELERAQSFLAIGANETS